jgi:hypothetical protein
MRFGAGRIVYVATDEIWRWRYGRGEVFYERFWLPLLRFLARDSISRTGKGMVLEATPQRAVVEQPVRISARVADESLISGRLSPEGIDVRVTRESAAGAAVLPPRRLKLSPERHASFAATWIPEDPGPYRIELEDPVLAAASGAAAVEVRTRDDEMRFPQSDHAALKSLAERTGGALLPPDSLSRLEELIPNRQVRILGAPEIETLWDRPVVLVLFVFLLAVEWFGRRWLHLA